jgi:hypothetical protein
MHEELTQKLQRNVLWDVAEILVEICRLAINFWAAVLVVLEQDTVEMLQ